ncbi:hypothetical protein GCM10011506_03060 [Marivirga lumbricoides]|uniref:Carbohydrate-binding domain-containing protein n=1 Tax=Marivirga lumbricoides TaxID=1046115 RepID=A0ABQ1LAF2_9BACT|nr:hypothetical protein GCM10011506_03060 [Marivirga lumbricoides]
MKLLFPLLLLSFFISCQSENPVNANLVVDVSTEIVQPKKYIVAKAESLTIDGFANESAWQNADFTDSFIDIEGVKTPRYNTQVKMLWDDNFLYVYAEMEEPHIWGDLKQRDTIIFYNNDFEVFISPSGSTYNYGEIEINSLGTVWDLLLDRPYRDGGKANNHWNLDSLKTAVHIEGSLNDHSDIDSLWTVEMAIPMKALIELKNDPKTLPKEGEQWRINFSRVEWDYDLVNDRYVRKKDKKGNFLPEYNWVWSNQKVINMHEPEKWGFIQFTEDSSLAEKSFNESKNEIFKQVTFALFRQTKSGQLKELLEATENSKGLNVKYSSNDTLEATFYKTNFGFEYKVNFPDSEQAYIINESGKIKLTNEK